MAPNIDRVPTGSVGRTSRWRRWSGAGAWALLAISVVDLILLRRGSAPHPPSWLGVLVGVTIALFVVRWIVVLTTVARRHPRPVTSIAELVTITGIVVSLAAGSANWLLGLQGYVILHEREVARLRHGADLQLFESGPLADLDEMNIRIGLDEVELVPTGDGAFFPRSVMQIERDGERTRVSTDPHTSGSAGNLRFYQGAFGFAPRVAVLRGDDLLFDRVVPFVTRLHHGQGITFTESFEIEAAGLRVDGEVDLASLDDAMRGHASLGLALHKDEEPLGRGTLLPGHFADLEGGYRVGFVDLARWSEIDVSRRNYVVPVVGGGIVALVGALIWPLAAWRRW